MNYKSIAIIILLAAQFACSGAGDIKSNRSLWFSSGIKSYRMKLKVEKTGHAGPMGNMIIEVKDGEVVSMSKADHEWLGGYVEGAADFNTVPKMFDFIEQAKKSNPDSLNITYDSTLGYPKRVGLDRDSDAVDDELTWEVLSLEKIG